MQAKDIKITGTLAANIAYYADQAGMQPEEYIEYVTTRIMMPLTILDLLDILPERQHQNIYLFKEPSPEFYRLDSDSVPAVWMEAPIKKIQSGGIDMLIIELEDAHAQEDS